LLATVVIMIGTVVTMIAPFRWINDPKLKIAEVKPYTPLQLEGRDIYIREGCNNCHTQTVRPLLADVERYGDYSKPGEFVYDQPFLWGSRRTGPDLARIGGKYPDAWHYKHMADPQAMVPRSNMPKYAFLQRPLDTGHTEKKMKTLKFTYAVADIEALKGKTEMDAMVAYLQKLGSDIPWRKARQ
jgi:cytochrome c oxidase cbb3-type subunit 2